MSTQRITPINLIFLSILTIFLFSCNEESIEKEVFYGFKLGRSLNFNWEKEQELVQNGVFTSSDETKFPYLVNEIKKIGKSHYYYSSPYFFRLEGDTTIVEIDVLYFTNINNLDMDMEILGEHNRPINIPRVFPKGNPTTPHEIMTDVVRKINDTYGIYTSKNSNSELEEYGVSDVEYNWKDKNGVNIELSYHPVENPDLSSIILKYKLTENLTDKIKSKKIGY